MFFMRQPPGTVGTVAFDNPDINFGLVWDIGDFKLKKRQGFENI